MKELSLWALSTVQKNIEKGITPVNAALTQEVKQGNKTLRDTGRLRASLTARHSESEAVVGTNVPYAQVHNREDGRSETVIRAKSGKSLAIPASARVRTCLKSSQKKRYEGQYDELQCCSKGAFAVLPKSPLFFKPCKTSLYDPPFGNNCKCMQFIAFDYLYRYPLS